MKTISYVYEKKAGRNYTETYRTTDPATVYQRLASTLCAKYINCASWVKRITTTINYDGTKTVKAYDDQGGRLVFTVEQ